MGLTALHFFLSNSGEMSRGEIDNILHFSLFSLANIRPGIKQQIALVFLPFFLPSLGKVRHEEFGRYELCSSLGSEMSLVILSSRNDCRSLVKVLRDRGVGSDCVQVPLISLHSIVDTNHEQFSRASNKWRSPPPQLHLP